MPNAPQAGSIGFDAPDQWGRSQANFDSDGLVTGQLARPLDCLSFRDMGRLTFSQGTLQLTDCELAVYQAGL